MTTFKTLLSELNNLFIKSDTENFIKCLHDLVKIKGKENLSRLVLNEADLDKAIKPGMTESQVFDVLNVLDIKFVEIEYKSKIGFFENEEFSDLEFNLHYYKAIIGEFKHKSQKADTVVKSNAKELFNIISKEVQGQDEAIKNVVSSWLLHKGSCAFKSSGLTLPRSTILLQGSTGSGKTFIFQTLAKTLNIPFIHFDASKLTAEGYVGSSVEDIMINLYMEIYKNNKDEDYSIIFLDEIDKLTIQSGDKNNVGTYGAQRNLLTLLESDVYTFDPYTLTKRDLPSSIDISRTMFVLAGSFSLLEEKKSLKPRSIGFGKAETEDSKSSTQDSFGQQSLVEAGIMPELAGRIGRVVVLNPLSDEALLNIMSKSYLSLENKYDYMSHSLGLKFKLTEEMKKNILSKTKELKLGARGLNSLVQAEFIKQIEGDLYA
jgi:ATP-dependent Clp protease ATP-binding subunit ClpX